MKVWNFPDRKWISKFIGLTLPSIKYTAIIYITRQYPEITSEIISKEILTSTLTTITPIKYTASFDSCIKFHFNKYNLLIYIANLRKMDTSKIQIRIISAKVLPFWREGFGIEAKKNISIKSCSDCCTWNTSKSKKLDDPYFDGIIIHVHGGGFISMSSGSHQSYTRQ